MITVGFQRNNYRTALITASRFKKAGLSTLNALVNINKLFLLTSTKVSHNRLIEGQPTNLQHREGQYKVRAFKLAKYTINLCVQNNKYYNVGIVDYEVV